VARLPQRFKRIPHFKNRIGDILKNMALGRRKILIKPEPWPNSSFTLLHIIRDGVLEYNCITFTANSLPLSGRY
jgi:hypothetical protein